ncbi:DUF934 domain-containing protein [Kordiimonas lipolytica]|uniref:DUF934 domain-containing protein n=1 Tax=Kordiimonas lipolytica TaxID=1662421 RepID=A0ABV8UCT5_9PROT|nr:DUF934 domain-containing protein [Kordiimonas lipolytica]
MALVNLTGIQAGDFAVLAEDQTPYEAAAVAVPLSRLKDEGDDFFKVAGPVGAVLATDTNYTDLAPLMNKLAFVVIDFPAFGDGRGFSLAVRLRKDLGFKGEIRATGPVIPDQALFLLRAGFDTVEVADTREASFKAALKRFDAFYQTDYTGQVSLAHARHGKDQERKAS